MVRVNTQARKYRSYLATPKHLRRSHSRNRKSSSSVRHCVPKKNGPTLDKEMLLRICSIASPSGHEIQMTKFLRDYGVNHLKNLQVIIESGELYFVRLAPNASKSQTILFDAHIDQVGCRVMRIDESGFLVCRCFGINSTDMNGRVVSIRTRKGVIKGVVVIMPPHLNTPNFSDDELRIDNPAVLVDIFTKNKRDSAKIVEIGDVIYLEPSPSIIRDDVILGAGLDNHVGTYTAFELARFVNRLPESQIRNNFIVHFSCREEVGNLRYLSMLSKHPHLPQTIDLVIVVDTDIATDVPNIPVNITSESHIGKGVIVSRNLVDEHVIYRFITDIARKNKIAYQTTMSDGNNSGNNLMLYTRTNVLGHSVGIPLRYMHSDVECVSLSDISCTLYLLASIYQAWTRNVAQVYMR